MNDEEREGLVYRIMSGETVVNIMDKVYKLSSPSSYVKYMASKVYTESINDTRFESWFSEKQCKVILITNGLCDAAIDENMKTIEKRIEDLKVELLGNMFDDVNHKKTRKIIDMVKKKHRSMLYSRHSLDHLTSKGFAESEKQRYIISKTVKDESGEILWKKEEDVDTKLLEKITSKIHKNIITSEQIRELSRTEPWRGYWSINKTDPFNVPVQELTSEQKTLILYSKMYDSVRENPECPSDDIMKDDDLFDGWMITEQRKREGEKTKMEIDKRLEKYKNSNADELYIIPQGRTREEQVKEAEEIFDMNDTHGKIIIGQRKNVVKRTGRAVDGQFLDRQLQKQTQIDKAFKSTQGK